MKPLVRSILSFAIVSTLGLACQAADPAAANEGAKPAAPIYLAVNPDLGFPARNSISFYLAQDTQLTFSTALTTEGFGIQGGFFGTSRITSVPSLSAPCIYVSDAGSNDIASISLPGLQLMGTFLGSDTDDGSANGIGMAVNANFLYASFSASNTIGTFAVTSGCGLTFLGDISAIGRQGGSISGMAVHGTMLVVAYGDGSIESFNVANGMPVSNGDLQNSSGYDAAAANGPTVSGNLPAAVDITQDGKFAIFGDISALTIVEVSSLTSGKLGRTSVYPVGNAIDAGNIRLSPDQRLIYIANSEGGTVTAAFFDAATGKVSPGCTSPTLRGFNVTPWLGSVVTRDTTGTGGVVYVAEFGRDFTEVNHGPSSEVGILAITSDGTTCSLNETSNSPVTLGSPGVLSIGVYPPRPF
jgi:hypothetical protein